MCGISGGAGRWPLVKMRIAHVHGAMPHAPMAPGLWPWCAARPCSAEGATDTRVIQRASRMERHALGTHEPINALLR